MSMLCPSCGGDVSAEDINVPADVAFCRECETPFKLSDQVAATAGDASAEIDPFDPPRGAWYSQQGGQTVIGASARSASVVFLLPFTLIWSGGSMLGIYGTQLSSGQFNLMLSLFGIPFLAGSVFLWALVFVSLGGAVEVRLTGDEGVIFTGVGSIGWRRRFRLSDYTSVRDIGVGHSRGGIVLDGKRQLMFGSLLKYQRRHFVAGVLRQALVGRQIEVSAPSTSPE